MLVRRSRLSLAGRLREQVDIQVDTPTRAADGGEIASWATVATVFAEIVSPGGDGREFQHAEQTQAQISHRITLRYYSGLTTSHRLLHGTRVFEIVSVRNVAERDVLTECLCQEAV